MSGSSALDELGAEQSWGCGPDEANRETQTATDDQRTGGSVNANDGDDDIAFQDGPGTYGLTLDRRAVGYSDRLLGVLMG